MRILEQGWLYERPELNDIVGGVYIPPETRTRKEEYTFALEVAPLGLPGKLLDVATGYVPEWHLFGVIMGEAGWLVDAIDLNPDVMKLPAHFNVCYGHADAVDIPFADNSFDYVTCISAIEHTTRAEGRLIVQEMVRCCKPGGRLVLTADMGPWLPVLLGGYYHQTPPPESGLNPQVFYVIAEK